MGVNASYITIITPCYNEGQTVIRFLEQLEYSLSMLPYHFSVVVVNDCSTDNTCTLLDGFRFRNEAISLHIINTLQNSGHQKAIYDGMCYAQSLKSNRFIIMDADGEDDPAVIPQLLQPGDAAIAHVVRSKRSESAFFRVCYTIYRGVFYVFTGRQMNYGNYCLITRAVLDEAINRSFIHLAAFLSRLPVEKKYVTAARSKRIGGRSKMGYWQLIRHACNSFVQYGMDGYPARFLFAKRIPGKQ